MSSLRRFAGLQVRRFSANRREASRAALPRNTRRLSLESLDPRLVLSASPYGAMVQDTGEYLLGSSAVTVAFMESTGAASTEDWNSESIANVKAKIEEALLWWQDTLANKSSVHRISFTTDYQYADNPVPTTVEPIAEKSNVYTTWVNDFLDHVAANTSDGISADLRKFNDSQRQQHGTDWGFTIFVVNDENDLDGMFAEGGSFRRAFAFAGGRYMVVPAGRPASTFAHELGHMFWARDEYAGGGSYTDQRGYYDAQNTNAYNNPIEGFVQQPSIMASGTLLTTAYANHTSSQSSFEMLGWRDTDADGVFDVLDVPHTLVGSGQPVGDSFIFEAVASVNTLRNENSSGHQSDITINEIDVVEYRFDDGAWIVHSTPGAAQADIELSVVIPDGAQQISIQTRSVDAVSQQTVASSNVFVANVQTKSLNATDGLGGIVWLDANGNDQWDVGESGVPDVELRLVDESDALLELQSVQDADPFADGVILNGQFPGMQLAAVGTHVINANVYSRDSDLASTGDRVFANFNAGSNSVVKTWGTDSRTLRVTFDVPQTHVAIDALADDTGDVARLEAYDATGNLLVRTTSQVMQEGDSLSLEVNRPSGDIAYVIARAHYNTEVLFDNLVAGPESTTMTDANGNFRFQALPVGDYRVQAVAEDGQQLGTPDVQQRSLTASQAITDLMFGMDNPPWTNPFNSEDINNDGIISPLDALLVINYLNENGVRELPVPSESESPPPYWDSSGDGWVTSLDALRVINFLNAQAAAEGESMEGALAASVPMISLSSAVPIANSDIDHLASQGSPLESASDYLYHTQVMDLVLELWFAGESLDTNELLESELGLGEF